MGNSNSRVNVESMARLFGVAADGSEIQTLKDNNINTAHDVKRCILTNESIDIMFNSTYRSTTEYENFSTRLLLVAQYLRNGGKWTDNLSIVDVRNSLNKGGAGIGKFFLKVVQISVGTIVRILTFDLKKVCENNGEIIEILASSFQNVLTFIVEGLSTLLVEEVIFAALDGALFCGIPVLTAIRLMTLLE